MNRGTSLIRNCLLLETYGRPMPRALWWSLRWTFYYERGTPVLRTHVSHPGDVSPRAVPDGRQRVFDEVLSRPPSRSVCVYPTRRRHRRNTDVKLTDTTRDASLVLSRLCSDASCDVSPMCTDASRTVFDRRAKASSVVAR